MTISELRDYLYKYTVAEKGNFPVVVCDSRDNPLSDGMPIIDVVFIETRSGDCKFVLQTD